METDLVSPERDREIEKVLQDFSRSVERFILVPDVKNYFRALIDSRYASSHMLDYRMWEENFDVEFVNKYIKLIDLLYRQIEIIRDLEYSSGELVDYCRRDASRDLASVKFMKQDLTNLSEGRLGSIGVYSPASRNN